MPDPAALPVRLVRTRPTKGAAFGRALALVIGVPLISGAALMFLLPLAHQTLGTPDLAPGYVDCALLVLLARLFTNAFRRAELPVEFDERTAR